tara:strand:- start:568 stop:1032 length:465 start_codon:yes stop_codon:yes gene_type:complete
MPKPSDKWIPWYFVAFFAVLAILDGIFVFLATSTHTGVVTQNAYEKGLNYNKVIEAYDAQHTNNIIESIGIEKSAIYAIIKIADTTETTGTMTPEAYLKYVGQEGFDFKQSLPAVGKGKYQQLIDFPTTGQWDLTVAVTWNKKHYQKTKRLYIQ